MTLIQKIGVVIAVLIIVGILIICGFYFGQRESRIEYMKNPIIENNQ